METSRGGDREYLYDLDADVEEKHNLAEQHPEIAKQLREDLASWAAELDPPGLTAGQMSPVAHDYFDFYLEGKEPSRRRERHRRCANRASEESSERDSSKTGQIKRIGPRPGRVARRFRRRCDLRSAKVSRRQRARPSTGRALCPYCQTNGSSMAWHRTANHTGGPTVS